MPIRLLMIFDDKNANAVLRIAYDLAAGRPGVHVRTRDIASRTAMDPAVVFGAVEQLVDAGMLHPGATDDRVCVSAAAIAWIRSHPTAAVAC